MKMNKKQILEMTGLSESDFYKKYRTKEDFIKEFGSGGIVNENQFMNMSKPPMYGKGGPVWAGLNADKNKNYGVDIGIPLARSKKPNSQDLYMTGGMDFVNGNPEGNIGVELSNQYAKGHLRRSRGFRFDGSIGGGVSTGNNETTPYVKGEAKVGYQYIGKGNKNKNLFPYLHAQHESKIPVGKYSNVGTEKDVNDYSKFGMGIEGDLKGGIHPYANFGYSLGDNTPYLQAGVRKTFGQKRGMGGRVYEDGGFVRGEADTNATITKGLSAAIKPRAKSKNFLDGAADVGRMIADNNLAFVGLDNVIQDDDYKTNFGGALAKGANVLAPISKAALPILANAVVPGSGVAVSAAQNVIGNFNPKDQNPSKYDKIGGAIGKGVSMLGPLAGGLSGGVPGDLGSISTSGADVTSGFPTDLGGAMFAEAGGLVASRINIEGSGIQQGSKATMGKKGELLVQNGKIFNNYVSRPPHPTDGMNPMGNTDAQPGTIVVPKGHMTKTYINSALADRKLIENSLIARQSLRSQKEGNIEESMNTQQSLLERIKQSKENSWQFKKGGLVKKYALGGPVDIDALNNFTPPESALDIMRPRTLNNGVNDVYDGIDRSPLDIMRPQMNNSPEDLQFNREPMGINDQLGRTFEDNTMNNSPLPREDYGNYKSAPRNPLTQGGQDKRPGDFNINDYMSKRNLGSALSTVPIATNLAKGIFGKVDTLNSKDYMTKANMKYGEVTDREAQRKIDEAYNVSRKNIKESGRYGLGADLALANIKMKQKADSTEFKTIENVKGKYTADAANKEIEARNNESKFRVDDYNLASKGKKNDYLNKGLEQIGQAGNQMLYDESFFEMLPGLTDDPKFKKKLEEMVANRKSLKINKTKRSI